MILFVLLNKYAHIHDIECRVMTYVPMKLPYSSKSCGGSNSFKAYGPVLQLMLMSYWWQMHIITSLTGLSTGALHNLLLVAHIITYCACSQTFEQKKDCSQSIEKCVFSVSKVQESKLITSNNTMHWLTSYSKIQVKIKFMLLLLLL